MSFLKARHLVLASLLSRDALTAPITNESVITVGGAAPSHAGVPLEAFVSFSIELAFFPDYAGNSSSPNAFSSNLLSGIGNLTGTKPYIRVGGNTQFALIRWHSSLAWTDCSTEIMQSSMPLSMSRVLASTTLVFLPTIQRF